MFKRESEESNWRKGVLTTFLNNFAEGGSRDIGNVEISAF